ncbi:NIPSNAP family protein, partial [Mesorhizobium sp. M7A.T.Ca.TU.009.01.3.2]
FVKDPAWTQAREDSERDGQITETITNQILAPTSFSAVS